MTRHCSEAPPPSRLATRVFALLLWAYPPAFRRRYHDDLMAFFAADRRHPRYAGTWTGPARFWLKTIKDLATAAARERAASIVGRVRGHQGFPTSPSLHPYERTPQRQNMNSFFQDLRFAVRGLMKTPASAGISVAVFGMGIGLCTIMFSIIYGVFFRGLGVPESDRLLLLNSNNLSRNVPVMPVSQHDFYDWREQQTSFEGLGSFSRGTVNLSDGNEPERYSGAFVTANIFDLLRVQAVLGRSFQPGDDAPGAPMTVILGHDVWENRYDSDPAVIGRATKVNGEAATIIGVMPDGFEFPQDESLWVPRRDDRTQITQRGGGTRVAVLGRLNVGVLRDQVELEFAAIATRLAEEYPQSNEGVGVVTRTFVDQDTSPELVAILSAMMAATIFVLLIACANVANLLLARAALRTREAAIRGAMGASRLRIVFPFFAEALLLAAGGAVLGIGIAYLGTSWFEAAVATAGKPYYMVIAVDLPILTFVVGVTLLTATISGAAPAFQISRADVNGILKDESRGSSGLHAGRLSKVLVVGEVALSCALLVGAGLMTKSIVKLRNNDYSFEIEGIFTARLGLFAADYPSRADRVQFFHGLEERLRAMPGARAVALATGLPTTNGGSSNFGIEGQAYETDQDYHNALVSIVTPGFFETFETSLLRGRDFTVEDDTASIRVAVVNERFAEKFFPAEDPVGRRFRIGTSQTQNPWTTIVGVAPNMRMEDFGPAQDSAGFYVPLKQFNIRFVSVAVRTAGGNPMALTSNVRQVVRGLDPDLPIYNVYSMKEFIGQSSWFYGVFGSAFIAFGIAALFMASVGLYGVLSFSVSRRVQEMGIRMALGAGAGQVIKLVLRQGLMQMGVGLAIGLALAFGLSNVVGVLMFEVEPRDPMVFGTIVLVIAAVGMLASFVPARRATSVDPMAALRYE
jgi:predicted permease